MTATTSQPTATATPSVWAIDGSHTTASFTVRHMMITNVRGEFQKVSGTVQWDPAKPEATKVQASLEVASISTREAQRDAHLKSADFFDAEKFPTIDFVSKSLRLADKGYELVGDLTIHGTTNEVVLAIEGPTAPHKDPWGNTRIGASARTKIKRSAFGMTWNSALEAGGVLVADDVNIELDVSLVLQK